MIEIKGQYSIHVPEVDMSLDLTNVPTSSGKSLDLSGVHKYPNLYKVLSLDLPWVHECPNLYKCGPWTYLGSMNVPTSTSVFPDLPWVHECPNLYKCGPWTYMGSMNVKTSASVVPWPTLGPWMSQPLQVCSPDLRPPIYHQQSALVVLNQEIVNSSI